MGTATSKPADAETLEWILALSVLDGVVTRLAADRLTPALLERLHALLVLQTAAHQRMDAVEFAALNDEFHDVIYDACPVSVMKTMIHELKERIYGRGVASGFTVDASAMQLSLLEHRGLLQLLEADPLDRERIEEFARWHKLSAVGAVGRHRMEPELRSLGANAA